MLWKDTITLVSRHLEEAGIADSKANAEYLALHILGFWNRSELRNFFEKEVPDADLKKYESLVARRLAHEPLQHIIGETEFFGLRLFTSPAALIPRPETEILVEEVLREVDSLLSIVDSPRESILDIGTGTGAIALALAAKLPDADILGIDISADAIALAKKNKARLGLENVTFEVSDIFANVLTPAPLPEYRERGFDIIVSNPPYISTEEFEELDPEVKNFDPRIALTDESDGLIFYRRIAGIAPMILKKNGKIIVETGYNGARQVQKIFEEAGLNILRIVKDLQGIQRVVVASLTPKT